VVVLFALFCVTWRQPPDLLARSRRIASLTPTGPPAKFGFLCQWFWLSDEQIVVIRDSEPTLLNKAASGEQAERRAMLLDVRTGKETEIQGFADRLKRLQRPYGGMPIRPLQASSDGSMIIWTTPHFTGREDVFATRIDGSLVGKWPHSAPAFPSYVIWDSTGRGWFRLMAHRNSQWLSSAVWTTLDNPHASSTVRLRTANMVGSTEGSGIGFDADRKYILCDGGSDFGQTRVRFWKIDLARPDLAPEPFQIAPPGNRNVWCIDYSRETNRLAWLLGDGDYSQDSINPLRPRPPALELWVSRLDGKEMKLVGIVEDPERSQSKTAAGPCRWSPNGKQIGFAFRRNLYIVKVD
jgi:hypothetical protein